MNINEAKQILEDNDYILSQLSDLGVSVNNGIQDIEQTTAYKIDKNNPVCPCCGKKLKLVNMNVETDSFIGESTLNEHWENDFLKNKVADVAWQLYQEELEDVQPELDEQGNVTNEYLLRFEYTKPAMKKAIKRASIKLANDFKEDGFNINPWYCEQEIYEALKDYARTGVR